MRHDATTLIADPLLVSEVIGLDVVDPHGALIGHVADLTVRLGAVHPSVHRVVVRSNRRSRVVLPWRALTWPTERTGAVVADAQRGLSVGRDDEWVEADELLLGCDVLDTQVVDLKGVHLARVADLFLLNHQGRALEVVAADLGFGALLRRTGLGGAARALTLRPVAVDWQDLHLTSSRAHAVQISTLTAPFRALDSQNLARLLTVLTTDDAVAVLGAVAPRQGADAVRHSHPVTARRLVRALDANGLRRLLDAVPSTQTAAVRDLMSHRPDLAGRRFRRLSGWRRYRPPGPPGASDSTPGK